MDIGLLQALLPQLKHDEISLAGPEVIGYYGRLFHPDNLDHLTAEEFLSFLRYENNKHWTGINRQGGMLTQDMDHLRAALHILLDESRPVEYRLDELFPKNQDKFIKGLGRAVATPILMMVYPGRYGVYNSISEQGLRKIGAFPDLPRGASFAETYSAVNAVLLELAAELGISLWDLDGLWWRLPSDDAVTAPDTEEEELEGISFSLERYLSDYLYEHWDQTIFGEEYALYEEGSDPAQEYPTSVGKIDLLARHRHSGDWLVVELKRDRPSDAVLGQIMRYMGWVHENLAGEGERIRGLIVLHQLDEKLRYSLMTAREGIDVYTYEVSVSFSPAQVSRF